MKYKTFWVSPSVRARFVSLRKEASYFKRRNIKNEITNEFDILEKLYLDICAHPHAGLGHPHLLGHGYSGWWSRHVDNVHRIIYKVDSKKGFLFIREMGFDYHSKSSMFDETLVLDEIFELTDAEKEAYDTLLKPLITGVSGGNNR